MQGNGFARRQIEGKMDWQRTHSSLISETFLRHIHILRGDTMPRPVHFEIHAANPEKIVTFYAELFGWKITHLPELTYWMIETGEGDGINGGLMKRIGPKPAVDNPVNAYVCSIGIFVRRRICG